MDQRGHISGMVYVVEYCVSVISFIKYARRQTMVKVFFCSKKKQRAQIGKPQSANVICAREIDAMS